MMIGTMELSTPTSLVSPYLGEPDDDETASATARRDAKFIFAGGTSGGRPGYYLRWALFRDRRRVPPSTVLISADGPGWVNDSAYESLPACGALDRPVCVQCEGKFEPSILLGSQFSLVLRGDSPTTQKFYDSVQYGAIPVIVSDLIFQVGLPFQCLVPYQLFTVEIPEAEWLVDAAAALTRVDARVSTGQRARMRRLMHHFRRDLLWSVNGSRVAENLLLTAAAHKLRHGLTAADCPFGDRSQSIPDPPFPPPATAPPTAAPPPPPEPEPSHTRYLAPTACRDGATCDAFGTNVTLGLASMGAAPC